MKRLDPRGPEAGDVAAGCTPIAAVTTAAPCPMLSANPLASIDAPAVGRRSLLAGALLLPTGLLVSTA